MVLGLLLVLLSAAAVVLLAFYNRSGGPDHMVTLFDRELVAIDGWQIFLAGVTLALLFCLGLWMMSAAGRRSRAIRAEIRAARDEARTAEAERDRLAGQVDNGGHQRYDDVRNEPTTPVYTGTQEPARRRFMSRRHQDEQTPTTTAP